MNKPYISLKVVDKKGKVRRSIASRKKRRIFRFIKAKKSPDCVFEVCIIYQKEYRNEGIYKSKKGLLHALEMFTEKG